MTRNNQALSLNSTLASVLIGVDHMLKEANRLPPNPSFPPYNLVQSDDDHYQIEFAVAGYSEEELEIKLNNRELIVSGTKTKEEQGKKTQFLHQGIAGRNFTIKFMLGEHIEVKNAELKNGILTIQFERNVPEEKKPKTIEIKS